MKQSKSDIKVGDCISCWRIVHKDLIPSVLEFFFKRTRECLEQGGTLMIRIAHGIENLVAKMRAVWQHVLNMHGIITFEGVNVHLIRGIILAPFDGIGITMFLIDIEGPWEQKFLVRLARKDNLHGVVVVVVLQNVKCLASLIRMTYVIEKCEIDRDRIKD
jgi:hypothetical protein